MCSIHFYCFSHVLGLKFAETVLKCPLFLLALYLPFFSLTPFLWTANPCPVPFIIPENALLSEVDFHVGQNVSIRCREGYQLKGQSVITCNADETWTPATAKCEKISCGPPAHVENALIRGSFYQYGDMITYSCYSGYMLEGPMRSICLENGTWTTPPTCKGKSFLLTERYLNLP